MEKQTEIQKFQLQDITDPLHKTEIGVLKTPMPLQPSLHFTILIPGYTSEDGDLYTNWQGVASHMYAPLEALGL